MGNRLAIQLTAGVMVGAFFCGAWWLSRACAGASLWNPLLTRRRSPRHD